MKIRNGFVSNSSASSFVVILPSSPQSVEDVEKLFFPNGYTYDSWDDYGEEVTPRLLAETLWKDIKEQRQTDDVLGRLTFMCRDRYAIRDPEDALLTMGIPKEEREKLFDLEEQSPAVFGKKVLELMIEKARSYGASMQCFPPKDTKEVYLMCYGSGCGTAEAVMFNNFDFLEHLPFVVVMES